MRKSGLRTIKLFIFIACVGLLAVFVQTADIFAQSSATSLTDTVAEPSAINADPEAVLFEPFVDWLIDDVMLYWGDRCPAGPDHSPAASEAIDATYRLRRMPVNGGARLTLDTSMDADCANYNHLGSDDEAVYFYNQEDGTIEKVLMADPYAGPVTVAVVGNHYPTSDLKIKDGNLYYGTIFKEIMRVSTAGGAPVKIVTTTATPNDIEFFGNFLYWIDGLGVWFVELPCNGCSPIQYSDKGGPFLLTQPNSQIILNNHVNWVVRGNGVNVPDRIYRRSDVIIGPLGETSGEHSTQAFSDEIVDSAPVGYSMGDLESAATGNIFGSRSLYWTENHNSQESYVRRDGEIIATVDGRINHRIRVINNDVYFADINPVSSYIYKIPKDAEALQRDMSVDAIEVTQAIQNLENGVPLIADKDTYVRVYGLQVDGSLRGGAEAWLEGSRDGQPLPGSPLKPINGIQPLITGAPINRGPGVAADGDWLFRLPGSWNGEGELELKAVVDPRQAYDDTNLSNNTKTVRVSFETVVDPCLIFSPVSTHAQLPSHTDPIFWDTIDRLVSVWPVDDATLLWNSEPIEELELCWDWDGHCYGPYEMDQGWEIDNFPPDSTRVIGKLMLRQSMAAISVDSCQNGSSMHSVGIVHEDSKTNEGGFANFWINASWVQFKNSETSNQKLWDQPTSGIVLAQELTHNFWRYHVGCKDAEDSIFGFGSWPYSDRCKLDDRPLNAPSTHYGFDPISQQIIPPDQAGDFMTYSSDRWVSDFTFKDVLGILKDEASRKRDVDLAGETLLLSGVFEANSGLGKLFYSYVLPSEMLTDVGSGEIPVEVEDGHNHAHHGHGPTVEPDAHARILAMDGSLIIEYQIDLIAPDNHGANFAAFSFLNQFPMPEEKIGEIQMWVDGKLIDSVIPSANAPEVEILTPVVNGTVGDEMTISWRATDADHDVMLFSINYSPDGGESWLPLVTEHPGDVVDGVESAVTSYTLQSPETVPGSGEDGSYLRVIASDGFHTTVAEIGPFTVEDRAPTAIIQQPAADGWFEATESIVLRGVGFDAESGTVAEESVVWLIDDDIVGTGRQLNINGLAPGIHALTLQVTDDKGQLNEQESVINILPLAIEETSAPKMDGRCHDGVYLTGTPLSLAGYDLGGAAAAHFSRHQDDLWVCLMGLENTVTGNSEVQLFVDPNNSGGALAQSDDYRFVLKEDGTPQLFVGGGNGTFNNPTAVEFVGQTAATDNLWSAEFKIPASSLNLWGGPFSVAVQHSVGSVAWPFEADGESPDQWAEVAAESVPYLTSVSPGTVTVGDEAVVLEVEGARFSQDSILRWREFELSTTISGTDYLTLSVPNILLESAGEVELTVSRSISSSYRSNPMKLVIANKTPLVTTLSPSQGEAGMGPVTVTLTGQDFVEGSIVTLDGEPRPTRFVSATMLEVDLTAADLSEEQALGVTVLAPEPRLAASNTLEFVIGNPGPLANTSSAIYLPLIAR